MELRVSSLRAWSLQLFGSGRNATWFFVVRVQRFGGLGFGVWSRGVLGFRVQGFRCRVSGLRALEFVCLGFEKGSSKVASFEFSLL